MRFINVLTGFLDSWPRGAACLNNGRSIGHFIGKGLALDSPAIAIFPSRSIRAASQPQIPHQSN